MNIEIDEEHLQKLIAEETRRIVADKIKYVMNNGCADWFSQSNIKNLTYQAIYDIIDRENVDQLIKSIDKKEFSHRLSNTLAEAICDYLS